MSVTNHVANAVLDTGIKDATKWIAGSPVVSSDIAPFNSFLVRDLKLMALFYDEDLDVIADVEHLPVRELTPRQLKALRLALRLSFRITADFVRDLDAAASGQPIGSVPIQTIYAVALRHPRRYV